MHERKAALLPSSSPVVQTKLRTSQSAYLTMHAAHRDAGEAVFVTAESFADGMPELPGTHG